LVCRSLYIQIKTNAIMIVMMA